MRVILIVNYLQNTENIPSPVIASPAYDKGVTPVISPPIAITTPVRMNNASPKRLLFFNTQMVIK